MKLVKNLMLVSALGAFYSAQAEMGSLAKAFYAEASEAGKLGTSFDSASLDRILAPEFTLHMGQFVRSQNELKVFFTDLKKRAGGWTILHVFSPPSIQDGACDRIVFLWSVPGAKDLVVDAHIYSSAGKQLDKMIATVVSKDECFKGVAERFSQTLKEGVAKVNFVSGDATLIFDRARNSLTFSSVVADNQGKKFDLSVSVREHQEKSDTKSA